jgi:hypothetical protein
VAENSTERARRSRLARLYNITPEEYEVILAHQRGVCYICQRPPGKTRLAVDHDHGTGLVRGLLCWQCNAAVAKLKDDVGRAGRAWYYLFNPPATTALGEQRFGRTGRVTTKRPRKRAKKGTT